MMLKELRMRKGLSQSDLGKLAGVSHETVARIERGQKTGMKSALKICRVLEVEVDQVEGLVVSTWRV